MTVISYDKDVYYWDYTDVGEHLFMGYLLLASLHVLLNPHENIGFGNNTNSLILAILKV